MSLKTLYMAETAELRGLLEPWSLWPPLQNRKIRRSISSSEVKTAQADRPGCAARIADAVLETAFPSQADRPCLTEGGELFRSRSLHGNERLSNAAGRYR